MAVLKSKVAVFDWYRGLKTNLKTNKITVLAALASMKVWVSVIQLPMNN